MVGKKVSSQSPGTCASLLLDSPSAGPMLEPGLSLCVSLAFPLLFNLPLCLPLSLSFPLSPLLPYLFIQTPLLWVYSRSGTNLYQFSCQVWKLLIKFCKLLHHLTSVAPFDHKHLQNLGAPQGQNNTLTRKWNITCKRASFDLK